MIIRRLRMCGLCRQDLLPSAFYKWCPWSCRECMKGYMVFRRSFMKEHGRWPTVKEFRCDI